MANRTVYLDYGSTAPVRPSVIEVMEPFLKGQYGNASSPYRLGRESRKAIDAARELVASTLGVLTEEIIFTSGGTESLVLSLVGAYTGNRHRGKHIVTSKFEHHAVHSIFDFLREEMGAETEEVGIGQDGLVRLDELESMLREDTILVSIMGVNNEVGTIQDIETIVEMCGKRGILVHSDCVQAIGKMPVNFSEMGIDMAFASGHKFGATKGIGFLYVKKGTHLKSICEGSHEFGLRSGTENVAAIVGIARALEESAEELPVLGPKLREYRKQLWECIRSVEPGAEYNGDQDRCVVATMNFRLPGCDGESLVLALDREGIAVATGSACQTGSVDPSHVLTAMGLERTEALGSIRLSMGFMTSQEDVDRFVEVFPEVYSRLKAESVQ